MNLATIIYLVEVLDSLKMLTTITAMGLLSATLICLFVGFVESEESIARMAKNTLLPTLIIVSLMSILIPSKSIAYTMLGAHGIQQAAETERVRDLASNSLTLIERTIGEYNKKLDEELEGGE